MLTILLKILSILGILLLVILGVLLLIILTVLFVPVFYKIKGDKKPDLHIAVKVSWLLGLIRVQFLYPDPGTVTAKILFFKVFDSGKEEEEQKKEKKPQKAKEQKEQKDIPDRDESRTSHSNSTAASGKNSAGPTEKVNRQSEDSGDQNSEETAKQNPLEKLQYTFRKICDKIKNVRENVTHYKEILLCEDTKGLLNHGFMRLGKILKSIRPRKIRADIRFGTGAPDTTGYAYAIYGILCPYLGRHVLVMPDFEQAVLEGELYAAGHITMFALLWHGVFIVLDKRLRQFISKLKQED